MNTDYRLSIGLRTHPKYIRLKRRLGPAGCLGYITLLAFVAQNRPDGSLAGLDTEMLAIAADYEDGDADVFIATLAELRFLDGSGTDADPYRIHDWEEHNPWAAGAKGRSERARDAAQRRWSSRSGVGEGTAMPFALTTSHEGAAPVSMPSACAAHAPACVPHCSSPSPSYPLLTNPTPTNPPRSSLGRELRPESEAKPCPLSRAVVVGWTKDKESEPPSAGDAKKEPPLMTRLVTRQSRWPWLTCIPATQREHADRFEAFYTAYPRQEGPHEAWNAWLRLARSWTPAMEREIHEGLRAYSASVQWQDRTKVPFPATWLNGRRWEGTPPKGDGIHSRRTRDAYDDDIYSVPVPAVPTRYREFKW